jgi:hypothetical protein
VLERFGININAAENGVFLPLNISSPNPGGAAIHSTLHTNAYYEAVNGLLSQVTSRTEALEVLSFIRDRLLTSTFP